MNVEYTGRQCEITPDIRKQVENGLKKLTRILGDNFESKVILSVEKHRCKAEITISAHNSVVGLAESTEMNLAVGEALDNIERQIVKHRARTRNIKRQAKKKWMGEAPVAEMRMAVGSHDHYCHPRGRTYVSRSCADHRGTRRDLNRFGGATSDDLGRSRKRSGIS